MSLQGATTSLRESPNLSLLPAAHMAVNEPINSPLSSFLKTSGFFKDLICPHISLDKLLPLSSTCQGFNREIKRIPRSFGDFYGNNLKLGNAIYGFLRRFKIEVPSTPSKDAYDFRLPLGIRRLGESHLSSCFSATKEMTVTAVTFLFLSTYCGTGLHSLKVKNRGGFYWEDDTPGTIDDALIPTINRFLYLRKLSLATSRFDLKKMKAIALPHLQSFALEMHFPHDLLPSDEERDNAYLTTLPSLCQRNPQLGELSVQTCKFRGDHHTPISCEDNSEPSPLQLTSLTLNEHFTSSGLTRLRRMFPSLTHLSLRGSFACEGTKGFSQLTHLDLYDCHMTVEGLHQLSSLCPKLIELTLNLEKCPLEGLVALNMPKLQRLTLLAPFCQRALCTEQDFEALFNCLTTKHSSLIELHLSQLDDLKPEYFSHLRLPSLKKFTFSISDMGEPHKPDDGFLKAYQRGYILIGIKHLRLFSHSFPTIQELIVHDTGHPVESDRGHSISPQETQALWPLMDFSFKYSPLNNILKYTFKPKQEAAK